MQILIELTLFVNIAINFFIIKCTQKSVGQNVSFAIVPASVGAVIALVLPIFDIGKLANIVIQILLSLSICLFCFEIKSFKKFLTTLAVFWGYTFVFGGATLAFENIFGQIQLAAVLALACFVFVVSQIVIKHQNKVKRLKKFAFNVRLISKGIVVEEEGFLDSGNMLFDPVTKQPIILISFDIFSRLQPDINYVNAVCKRVDTKKLKNGHYVKINTVASGTSILVFTVDHVEIFEGQNKRDFENVSVGLSFSGFERALGKKILLHRELA